MTIPANLTHAEVGAYLVAVGQHCIDHDVCAEAVLDVELLKDEDYSHRLARDMRDANGYDDLEFDRALEILATLTLAEAITFVEGFTT